MPVPNEFAENACGSRGRCTGPGPPRSSHTSSRETRTAQSASRDIGCADRRRHDHRNETRRQDRGQEAVVRAARALGRDRTAISAEPKRPSATKKAHHRSPGVARAYPRCSAGPDAVIHYQSAAGEGSSRVLMRSFGVRESRLIDPEVGLPLPGMDGPTVAFVLGDFRIAEGVIDVIAQRAAHDGVLVELGERLAQRLRQRADAGASRVPSRSVRRSSRSSGSPGRRACADPCAALASSTASAR